MTRRGIRRTLTRSLLAVALAVPVVLADAGTAHAFELTTDYPVVRVGPGENAEMALEVTSPTVERVALSIVEAPQGWRARLTGGGFEIGAVFTDPAEPPEVTLERPADRVHPLDKSPQRMLAVGATGAGAGRSSSTAAGSATAVTGSPRAQSTPTGAGLAGGFPAVDLPCTGS